MFDLTAITPIKDFDFWFKRKSGTEYTWYILERETEEKACIGELDERTLDIGSPFDDLESEFSFDRIRDDFEQFIIGRPEYYVGRKIPDEALIGNAGEDLFETILFGAILIQHGDSEGIKIADRCLKWLRNTDFYSAPASTVYHESCPSGLLHHTLQVVDKIVELSMLPTFLCVSIEEAVITAIVHDWCKIELYESYIRNVKNEETGQWEQKPAYRRREPRIPLGHGTTSLYMAQKFFKVSLEQACAIRWHMSKWNTHDVENDDLNYSNNKYPLVLMLQFADQLAINRYECNEEFVSAVEFKKCHRV
jgi:hypothetical protein